MHMDGIEEEHGGHSHTHPAISGMASALIAAILAVLDEYE